MFRLLCWGYGKFEGFWPKKARENPRGKASFPLRIFPRLSPDAKHPGLAAESRRARSTMASSLASSASPSNSGNNAFLTHQITSAIEVQEMKSPGSGVRGLNKPPSRLCAIVTGSAHNPRRAGRAGGFRCPGCVPGSGCRRRGDRPADGNQSRWF